MKIALRRIVISSLGLALLASPWSAPASAQDLRLKNQPTLAAPRSNVALRNGPTLSAQKETGTTTASTPTTNSSSKWAPVSAAAPLTPIAPTATLADPVSTPSAAGEAPAARLSVGTLSPTPEMWFYEQARQDANNPEMIVRRRAEQAAAERKARIAARAWYGVSLSRPQAHTTPFTYYYSPTWTPNTKYPYSWTAPRVAAPIVIEARRPYVGVSNFGNW